MAILNFMTVYPGKKGKQTFFRDKVINSLIRKENGNDPIVNYTEYKSWYVSLIGKVSLVGKDKIHTIREDQKNRWKVGMPIDFFIYARSKRMYRFAPRVPVKSLQTISFTWENKPQGYHLIGTPVDRVCTIRIDDRFVGDAYFQKSELISGTPHIEQLAINDGFDTVEDFFDWFKEDFSGKIIHWTDLKY